MRLRRVEQVHDADGRIGWVSADVSQCVEKGLEALGAVRSLAMWVEAQEDELGMSSELFGQLGHACLFAGAQVSAVPMLVALAADDESGAAEDEVGSSPGAAAERLEGLVFPHGGHVKALEDEVRPLMLDARRPAGGFPEAGLADAQAVEGNAGMSTSEAGAAGMCAEIVDAFEVGPQMVGARKGFVAVCAGEAELSLVHGELMSEEVVGSRKDGVAGPAGKGSQFAMDDIDMPPEVVLPTSPIGTLGTLHGS